MDSENSESALVPTVREPIDGIWSGEFDIGGKGPYDFTAIHFDGKAYAYSLRAKAMCVGTVKLEHDNYVSNYALFVLDGGPFDLATITGKLKRQNEIAAQFLTLKGGETGALNLVYNAAYDSPSSLHLTAGSWKFTDRDALTTVFIIENEGTIKGHDSDNCEYSGSVDVIDPVYNAYQVNLTISECSSVNGEYEGVSFIENDQLSVQIVNEKYALFFAFDRQQ